MNIMIARRSIFSPVMAFFALMRTEMVSSFSIAPQGSNSDTWRGIPQLPTIYKLRPMPALPNSCARLPLEQIAPFFLLNFMISFQCLVVRLCDPSLASVKHTGKIVFVTNNGPDSRSAAQCAPRSVRRTSLFRIAVCLGAVRKATYRTSTNFKPLQVFLCTASVPR